jgi:addiction module RelB/DinJ family antitoxin
MALKEVNMADTATINVRMDAKTKDSYVAFCEDIGISASSLMNIFAKTVVRNQRVPFPLTNQTISNATNTHAQLFPANFEELDAMLAAAEATPTNKCIPAKQAFKTFEEKHAW